jgi:hypothetical protein
MAVLKHAGLVMSRKEERWIYYRLPDSARRNARIRGALEWLFNSLSDDEKIIEDARTMGRILKENPEALCKKQRGS